MLSSSVISLHHQFLCNKEMSKNQKNRWKLMKIANIDREILRILRNDVRSFNESFRKDVTYDNIESHKKPGLHSLVG